VLLRQAAFTPLTFSHLPRQLRISRFLRVSTKLRPAASSESPRRRVPSPKRWHSPLFLTRSCSEQDRPLTAPKCADGEHQVEHQPPTSRRFKLRELHHYTPVDESTGAPDTSAGLCRLSMLNLLPTGELPHSMLRDRIGEQSPSRCFSVDESVASQSVSRVATPYPSWASIPLQSLPSLRPPHHMAWWRLTRRVE
jgi:hypothetical protein